MYETDYNCIINSGFFIIKKTEKSKLILNKWLTDNDLFTSKELSQPVFGNNKWNDQAVLRLMVSKNIENITDNSIIIDYGILQHFNKNQQYIDLNKNINSNNIIYHKYDNINVKNSLQLTENQINNFKIPDKILELAPFDIILIDGPNGFNNKCPGRLLPIFWSKKYLSKEGTIVYIDDVNRNLENKCINKFLLGKPKTYFNERDGTIKVIM